MLNKTRVGAVLAGLLVVVCAAGQIRSTSGAATQPQTAAPPKAGKKSPAGAAATPASSTPTGTTPAGATPGTTTPVSTGSASTRPAVIYGGLNLHNASLTEVIDMLARQLKINYVLDPRVKGGVVLNTYGETKDIDTKSLLEMVLRINGFGMVKEGDLYRIVPLADIRAIPSPSNRRKARISIPMKRR